MGSLPTKCGLDHSSGEINTVCYCLDFNITLIHEKHVQYIKTFSFISLCTDFMHKKQSKGQFLIVWKTYLVYNL